MSKIGNFLTNLFTKGAAGPLEGIANTAVSLVKDKVPDADTSFIREKIRKGVSLSSKRVINLTGTSAAISMALYDMYANGLTWENISLCIGGMAFCVLMSWVTGMVETKKTMTERHYNRDTGQPLN